MSRIPVLPVLGVLIFALVLAGFMLVRGVVERRNERWRRRLNHFDPSDADTMLSEAARQAQAPKDMSARLDRAFEGMIQRTDVNMSTDQALGFILLCGVGLGLLFYIWRQSVGLLLLGLFIGITVPVVVFWLMSARQKRRWQEQLPDTFYLLARSLRSGLTLEQAIELVGEHGARPLADEFKRIAARLRLGLALPPALELQAHRLQLLDFNIFVSVVALHQRTGGNLALLLDRLAAHTRDRNQFRGYLRAATALGRASAIFLGLAGPALLVVYALWQPEHLAGFFETGAGWTLLGITVVLEIIGIIWLYYLLRVEY